MSSARKESAIEQTQHLLKHLEQHNPVMAGLMQDRFREHISVAEVLKANYGSTDDIERVEAIHSLESEIERLCSSREADVQTTLRGVSHLVLLFGLASSCVTSV